MLKKFISFFIRLKLIKAYLSHRGTDTDACITLYGFNEYVEYIITGECEQPEEDEE